MISKAKTYGKLMEAAARVGDVDRADHWFQELRKNFAPDLDHYNMTLDQIGDTSTGRANLAKAC